MEASVCFVVACGLILLLVWLWSRKSGTFPPGPIGLPIIGYYPFLGKYPYLTFMKLGKKYGNVFSVPLGTVRVVVLNDWPAVKGALLNQAETFNGRKKSIIIEKLSNYSDIIFSDGPGWRDRRRFTLQHLRNLGFGKSVMEDIIMEEIHSNFEDLKHENGKLIDVSHYFDYAFLNIIWAVVTGKRFRKGDEQMKEFQEIVSVLFQGLTNTSPFIFIPYLQHIFRKNFHNFVKMSKKMECYVTKELDEHEQTYREGNIRDLIDTYLAEIYKNEDNHQASNKSPFTRNTILKITRNLFNAGIDTSNNTLLWGLLYMATWPSIQRKVHDELDEIIGRERLPRYGDRTQLKYTNAVILEIMRCSSILPLSITHTTMSDTQLFGFQLPKHTAVMPNLWAIHHDPKYWKEPEVFNPERFINAAGQVEKPEYLIPFSVGGRMCLGESLAKMTSFLFFSCILHKYEISLPVGVKPPSLSPLYRITMTPKPFSLRFLER